MTETVAGQESAQVQDIAVAEPEEIFGPPLTIGGKTFRTQPELPIWALSEMAAAVDSGSVMDRMAATYTFITTCVTEAERGAFRKHMRELKEFSGFQEAVEGLIAAYSEFPTLRPSGSPDGPTGTVTPSVPDSSGTYQLTSVSRSPGTDPNEYAQQVLGSRKLTVDDVSGVRALFARGR